MDTNKIILNWINFCGLKPAAVLAHNAGIEFEHFYLVAFGRYPR